MYDISVITLETEVQAIVEKGESIENIDIPELLDELVNYINTTDDHPLIIAAIVHYQLVTIHPLKMER